MVPYRRPAHHHSGSNAAMPLTGAISARISDARPIRANAPAAIMDGSDPFSASSRTGWVPISDGIAGMSARYQIMLSAIPPRQATSAQPTRRRRGAGWAGCWPAMLDASGCLLAMATLRCSGVPPAGT